jgi:hypothetical protein
MARMVVRVGLPPAVGYGIQQQQQQQQPAAAPVTRVRLVPKRNGRIVLATTILLIIRARRSIPLLAKKEEIQKMSIGTGMLPTPTIVPIIIQRMSRPWRIRRDPTMVPYKGARILIMMTVTRIRPVSCRISCERNGACAAQAAVLESIRVFRQV